MSCPYKYILGIPRQGIHSIRIFGYSLNDILLTFVLAGITAYFSEDNFFIHLIFWLIIGEILHYLFGVQTQFLTNIGVNACPEKN